MIPGGVVQDHFTVEEQDMLEIRLHDDGSDGCSYDERRIEGSGVDEFRHGVVITLLGASIENNEALCLKQCLNVIYWMTV